MTQIKADLIAKLKAVKAAINEAGKIAEADMAGYCDQAIRLAEEMICHAIDLAYVDACVDEELEDDPA